MSLISKKPKGTKSIERTSLLVGLKIISRANEALDETEVWNALVDAFRKHPTLDVYQAIIAPDLDGTEAK